MKIITLGDSLMQENDASTFPQEGWPQELSLFLKEGIEIRNFAKNGRSTKSFMDEGIFAEALKVASKDDIVFISFGHNDEKKEDPKRYTEASTTYEDNLLTMGQAFAKLGCHVLFLSSIARLHYDPFSHLIHTHASYPSCMEIAAKKGGFAYINLAKLSFDYLNEHSYATDSSFFMICEAGEYPNYPQGLDDHSHLNKTGALWICSLLVPEFKKLPYLAGLIR